MPQKKCKNNGFNSLFEDTKTLIDKELLKEYKKVAKKIKKDANRL